MQGTSQGQTESLSWFPTNSGDLSASLTKQMGLETITSSVELSNELSRMASMSTCNTPQTVPGSPPDPSTNTYAPMYYYAEFSQAGIALNGTNAAIRVPNNIQYNGIEPVVMIEQSILQTSPTIPYAFFQGMLFALQTLLRQINSQWEIYLYGSGDRHSHTFTVPFHTPPSAQCPTCNGSLYTKLFVYLL